MWCREHASWNTVAGAAVRVTHCVVATGTVALLSAVAPQALRGQEAGKEEQNAIGYATVAEALIAVQKGMATEARMERGWTIVETKEKGIPVHWFFTHTGHPAHPAAIKRTMTYKDGAWDIGMAMLCEGPKAACDKLAEEFRVINERLEKTWKG